MSRRVAPDTHDHLRGGERDHQLGQRLLRDWLRFRTLPGGRLLFARWLPRLLPGSATIRPRVLALQPGRALLRLGARSARPDPRGAVYGDVLRELGELACTLAATTALPAGVRAVASPPAITAHGPACGPLTAEGRVELPPVADVAEAVAEAEIADAGGATVAIVRVLWRLSRP